ncbi:sialate O-acetylesterase [Dysgonomonas sp. 216]|uniref:sialate O-acetylesterase n=1 Tax=Dysgonomonas sp. 216 TaxID=2302934 RepID=UPI0013D53F27|nr:sialate O-acetylesterase [Dysgonomonas sp. 216]
MASLINAVIEVVIGGTVIIYGEGSTPVITQEVNQETTTTPSNKAIYDALSLKVDLGGSNLSMQQMDDKKAEKVNAFTDQFSAEEIDNLKTVGYYIRNYGVGTTPQLLIVSQSASGSVSQYRQYVYDSTGWVVAESRTFDGTSWSEWKDYFGNLFNGTFSDISELDNMKAYGIYRRQSGGAPMIVYVYIEGNIVYQRRDYLNTSSAIEFRTFDGTSWSEWTKVNFLSQSEQNNVNIVPSLISALSDKITTETITGQYVNRSTGAIFDNSDYRRSVILKISDYIDGGQKLYVDIGTFGASMIPVAYYNSETPDSSSFLGGEIETTSVDGQGQQLKSYMLNPPAEATHMVLSCNKNYYFNLYRIGALSDKANKTDVADKIDTKVSEIHSGMSYDPYNSINNAAPLMFKRSSILSNIPDDVMPLFIIIGQSNMDGRAPIASIPSGILDANNMILNYLMWNRLTSQYQTFQLGVNTGSENNATTYFSWDTFFMRKYLTDNPCKKVYAIRQTIGGVPITEKGFSSSNNRYYRWQPKAELIADTDKSMCLELLDKIQVAKEYATANNLKLMPVAILCTQGEGDADRASDGGVTDYPVNLSNLITWVRGLFLTPTLPFINIQIANYNSDYTAINTVFTEMNALDKYMRTVDMTDHQPTLDNIHYAATELQYAGETAYNYFKELMG